jgi:hypothetical protein
MAGYQHLVLSITQSSSGTQQQASYNPLLRAIQTGFYRWHFSPDGRVLASSSNEPTLNLAFNLLETFEKLESG